MKPGKGADRASVLAINPSNREDSAIRRTRLLAAFDSLDEDARADLLEAAERLASHQGSNMAAWDVRDLLRRVYAAAGW